MTVVINGTTGISTPGLSNSSTTTNTGNVTNSGTVTNASTISVGNATPAASGAGITFPATQSASTDANTLDDYEEGTWTPVLTPQTGSLTSQVSYGKYTKVGNLVNVEVSVRIVTVGTASGNMIINGLPFLPVWAGEGRPSVSLVREDNSTGYGYMAITANGQSYISLFTLSTNAAPPWTNNYQYTFNATYLTT